LRQHLIIYAKRPLPGYAKTRLGAAIGPEQAAGVYARLLYGYLHEIATAHPPEMTVELAVASPADTVAFAHAFPELMVRPQIEGALGDRMHASFQQAFGEGAEAVVLTGSDMPGLDATVVCAAFAELRRSVGPNRLPGVIGPAADGGYYLIGMRAPGADLFEGIAWSTDTVRRRTEELADARGVSLARLPQLADMDVIDDYKAWRDRRQTALSRPET